MRYDCDDPSFAGDFVEFSDSFSRAQQRAIWAAGGEDEELFLSLLRAKIVSLHLSCLDAPPILKAEDLIPERVEDMDVRLYTWFSYAWVAHLRGLTRPGKHVRAEIVKYLRHNSDDGSRPSEPEPLLDAILLDLFPGRMLEELDQMDLNRLYRAKIAARMQAVEYRRKRFLEGKIKPKDIEPDEWKLITQMDEWASDG